MFHTYGEIFEQRAHLYHRAMTLFPRARDEEFARVVEWAGLAGDNEVVCDMPAGGGYLRPYAPATTLIHIETSHAFARLCRMNGGSNVSLGSFAAVPLRSGSVQRVISLAALHHVEDHASFFDEAYRILTPGGRLCIADVRRNSPAHRFLDAFVHAHSSLGHRGNYIDAATRERLERCGFTRVEYTTMSYSWRFACAADMASYCQLLFGIDGATSDELLAAIGEGPGFQLVSEGCLLNWELLFFRATR